MKKKGLIIATIVMVLVLAVSLTTATYAWFSASAVTSLETFNISVTANNAVNIGFDADNSAATAFANLSPSNFVTGAVTTTTGTAGALYSGAWTGTSGLSATVDHNIQWGAQSKAVAAQYSSSAISDPSTSTGAYDEIGEVLAANVAGTATHSNYSINAANLDSGTTLTNVAKAYSNIGTSKGESEFNNGDFVSFILGVQPNGTTNLDCNTLCIALDWSTQTGATLGVLASLHVAYRVISQTGADALTVGTWQDVDIMGAYTSTTSATTGVTSNITNGTLGSAPQYKTAYHDTYGVDPGTNSTYMATITGLSTTIGYIDQIELVIYMDGNDPDCITSGTTNIAGALKLFFCTSHGKAD